MKTPKKKLTPSWEIYNRILWDLQFNQLVFYIGYEDRMIIDRLAEKLLVDWATSDIPWSRVQYIRCGDTLVWDRINRIDLFESDSIPLEAYAVEQNTTPKEVVINGISIVQKPTYWMDNKTAKVFSNVAISTCTSLKIATYNVLTNKYEKEQLYSKERSAAIVHELTQLDADILLLQEVDAPLLELLLQYNWNGILYSSDANRKAESYYQELVILSKFPFSWMEYQFSSQKKFPIATWNINGEALHLANVHLTSNRAEKAVEIRANQLGNLLSYLEKLDGTVLVGGDFNCRKSEGLTLLEEQQFVDSWLTINPNDVGLTFEPQVNNLAQKFSLSGLPARFDRIYLQDKMSTNWSLSSAHLFANQPFQGNLFASDHYGLLVSLDYQEKENSTIQESAWNDVLATYHSAIVIIPPLEIWEPIQQLRTKFDSKVTRWMPHITLVYGFLPDRYFEEAAQEISDLLKQIPSFELELKQFQVFSQKSEVTAWLEPFVKGNSNTLKLLQDLLQKQFWMKNSKLKSFTPHLSIGQFPSKEAAFAALPEWSPINFNVGKIALLSRHAAEEFKVRYEIELGTGNIHATEPTHTDKKLVQLVQQYQGVLTLESKKNQQVALDFIADVCSELLGQKTELYPLGSTALGTNTAHSDVDVLCAIPQGWLPLDFLEALFVFLEGFYQEGRLVVDAQVPILKLKLEGISIDLLCVNQPSDLSSLRELREQHRYSFDAQSWQAVSGILEVQSILRKLPSDISVDSFQWFVKVIKTWATQRGIKGNAFGFLGTYSWTILAAWVCQQIPREEDKEELSVLLSYFFDFLTDYNWQEPISIVKDTSYKLRPKQDRMPILTSVLPYYNSAKNGTLSTTRILKQEFERGADLIKKIKKGKATWEKLFESFVDESKIKLVLVITTNNQQNLQTYSGWLEGHLVGLIVNLEQEMDLWVRPHTSLQVGELSAKYVLGIQYPHQDNLGIIQQHVLNFIEHFAFDYHDKDALSFEFK